MDPNPDALRGDAPAAPAAVPAPVPRPRTRKSYGPAHLFVAVLATFLVTAVLCTSVGVLLYGGLQKARGASLSFADTPEVRARIAKAEELRSYLKADFLEELADERILDAMIAGMADNLGNPYTFYMSAETYALWEENLSGSYTGIGASVIRNKDGLVVITDVYDGGPADLAGVKAGDAIVAVDGTDVTGLKDENALAALVRGPAGTEVVLGILRTSTGERLEIPVTRGTIVNDPVVSRMLSERIGYVAVKEFSTGLADEFRTTVEGLVAQGATDLVLDLRNDPGGSAGEVVAMLDWLLPKGTIATLKGRMDGKAFEESWTSDGTSGVPEGMRYAILVNGSTASAAELFSGCLRDFGKAYLIGTQTYGKGSGTITRELSDGSAVNITTFRYYLPSGVSIEGEGLAPDLEVALDEDLQGLSPEDIPAERDAQLRAAVVHLANLP